MMHDGTPAEIAIVGNEGLVGIALFMGGETMPSRGDCEVDPQKRTPILLKKEVPKWANIVPRTRRNSGRKWLSW
jgi:hypothetical protein